MLINVDKYQIFNSNHERLLGITLDNKLSFSDHVSSVCKKACRELHTLSRVSKFVNTDNLRDERNILALVIKAIKGFFHPSNYE